MPKRTYRQPQGGVPTAWFGLDRTALSLPRIREWSGRSFYRATRFFFAGTFETRALCRQSGPRADPAPGAPRPDAACRGRPTGLPSECYATCHRGAGEPGFNAIRLRGCTMEAGRCVPAGSGPVRAWGRGQPACDNWLYEREPAVILPRRQSAWLIHGQGCLRRPGFA